MKDSEEQDDLWQLLGRAKTPAVSPYFARNVLREIRQTPQEKAGVLSWLLGRWRVVSLGCMAAVLVALNAVQLIAPHPVASQSSLVAVAPVQPVPTKKDYEVINHLDELVAYEEHSIWLDDSDSTQ